MSRRSWLGLLPDRIGESRMKWSHSRVECFNQCPFKFELRYIADMKTIPSDDASNPLIIGSAMHKGIETTVEQAIRGYFDSYNVITDLQENEAIKLSDLIPKVKKIVPKNLTYEFEIDCEGFRGFIDGLEELKDGTFNIYDFKYSNNIEHYLESPQLHLYKHYFERMTGKNVNGLYYVMIPKTLIRQRKNEDLFQFRKRLDATLEEMNPSIVEVAFDPKKVEQFECDIEGIETTTKFEKNESRLCDWCEYKECCLKGENYMILPSIERREIGKARKRKIWIYGDAFTGKTTMLDDAPNPLNLNTDGNIEFVTMPYIAIKDIVTVEGRVTKRKFAWEVLKETIEELEKKQNDFETIIIDLLEDAREMCRLYKYDQMGIEHESDSGYGKGWDIIKTEYLSTIRRLFNLDYENIVVVSHELQTEIKKKNGQTITKIAPNIQESIANKVAGMVDIVARAVVEDDGTRTLNFKSNEFVFGGGRLKGLKETKIPLSWDALMDVYDIASKPQKEHVEAEVEENEQKVEEAPKRERTRTRNAEPVEETPTEEPKQRRTRKARD